MLLENNIIDIKNINGDNLKTIEMIKLFMDKVVEELKLNVVDECSYQFEVSGVPYGATITYLLSESHFSIHTFAHEKKNY